MDGSDQGSTSIEEVVVSRDGPHLPKSCRPESVGQLALDFSRALEQPDDTAAEATSRLEG